MTPIVPFDPTGHPAAHLTSLRDAYSDAAIQAFVDKLRQLAVVRPDRCRVVLQRLDALLAGILDAQHASGRLTVTAAQVVRTLKGGA